MKLKYLPKHSRDWQILLLLALLAGSIFLAITYTYLYNRHKNALQSETSVNSSRYYETDSGYPKIVRPDKAFPPPADKQRNYYEIYNEGEIQYSVVWSVRNTPRNPIIGPNTFTIIMYNSRNQKIDLEKPEALSIGCIASDDPYRTLKVDPVALSFDHYETKKTTLDVDVSCRYIGTADGKYYWRTY